MTNFDYETWQLLFFFSFLSSSSSKLAASRKETTPKALLIFVPHKTQPPDGRKLPPLCARLQPVHFGRGPAGRGGGECWVGVANQLPHFYSELPDGRVTEIASSLA